MSYLAGAHDAWHDLVRRGCAELPPERRSRRHRRSVTGCGKVRQWVERVWSPCFEQIRGGTSAGTASARVFVVCGTLPLPDEGHDGEL